MRSSGRARPSTTRVRRLVVGVLAAVALVALTACAAIPTTGPVQTAGKVQDDTSSGFDYRPDAPVPGSDQETILRKFIDAATGPQDNYAIAREFLADKFSQKWNPRQGVTVRQGGGDVTRATAKSLAYTLTASATVDAAGQYTQAVRPTSSTLTFQFTKEHGQWRISYAPDGIILSSVSFESVFQAHAIYFYDPSYKFLVPDERWFLARSSTSTRIVSALLAGPSDWLKGAVVSAFPEGTQLSLNAVTVDNGSAQVDLTSDALKANTLEKVRMREQLTASLSTVASISSVSITVEGTGLAVPESTGTTAERDPDVDPRPLVVTNDAVGNATGTSVAPLSGIGDKVKALRPTSIELAANGSDAAVGNAAGSWIVRNGSAASLLVDGRGDAVPPSIDDQGFLWSGQRSDPRSITAYGFGGDPHTVASTLPSGELVAFRVSRDSTRALALIDTDSGAALYVMSIIRDAQKDPTAFGTPIRVQSASGDPVDATWASDVEVASLGTTSSGSAVTTSTIGGQATTLSRPSGIATTIVGGASGSLLLRMSDGRVLSESAGGWDDTGVTADVLGTQR
ncbi:LpqB family beta-propeller domain-containing protein [Curtobacterium sp. RRHDQ10]|uniref:LpqB family beta-propeller domain-containing protein n=1 Tax=Curtobacterium phyllosphaerae TaxID=3413379 RepID=UPI003BF26F7A